MMADASEILSIKPLIKTVRDVTIYPAVNDFRDGGSYICGIASAEPQHDPADFGICRFGKSLTRQDLRETYRATNWSNRTVLKGRYLYSGPIATHFGHFVSESVHRLWACAEFQGEVDGIIFLPDQVRYKPTNLLNEALRMFGVDRSKVVFVESLAIVEELLVPETGSHIGAPIADWYQAKLSRLFSRERYRFSLLPEALVVSRSKFRFVGRCAGFDYIVSELVKEGYFEFRPERYSLQRQLEFVLSADRIIWEEGSACHILELVPPTATKSALVRRRPDYGAFDDLIQKKEDGAIYNNVQLLDGQSAPHNRMAILLDPDELVRWLRELKFARLEDWSLVAFMNAQFADVTRYYLDEASAGQSLERRIQAFLNSHLKKMEPPPPSLTVNVQVTRHIHAEGVLCWALDTLSTGPYVYDHRDIHIRGWLLPSSLLLAGWVVARRSDGSERRADFEVARPDVLNAILHQDPSGNALLNCGFDFRVPLDWFEFSLFWSVEVEERLLAEVVIMRTSAVGR